MTLPEADQIIGWGFRGLGLLYVGGGAFIVHSMRSMLLLSRSIDKLDQMMREIDQPSLLANDPEDRGRLWWLAVGGALTFLTGVAMLAASKLCVYLLVLSIAYQALYLARQTKRVARAKTEWQADEDAPANSSWNAFGGTFFILGVALYLAYRHVLT